LPTAASLVELVALLFFELFHRKDVVEQPFEDDSIAVDRNINFILVTDLFETFVEVFHVLDQ
jgi:hypothetical protein